MSNTYIPRTDDNTPSSERSVYFDAPMMHIFSKGGGNDEDGYVAPSPAHSRIRTTTPLGNGRSSRGQVPCYTTGSK